MCRADHRLLPEVHSPPFAAGVFDVSEEAVALSTWTRCWRADRAEAV